MRLKTKARILFVVTTPFAANAFLACHFKTLSNCFDITLCVNVNSYPLNPEIAKDVEIVNIGFERKIAPLKDLIALVSLFFAIKRRMPIAIHSITPKAGLLCMLAGFLAKVPNRWHTFTGQVWARKQSFPRSILKKLDRCIVLFSTRVFADSISQCDFLLKERIVDENGISTLGLGSIAGVDTTKFYPNILLRHAVREELGVEEKVCVFLFVGRLVRDKGVFDLLLAFSEVAASSIGVELWVVGPDEELIMSDLKKISALCNAPTKWIGSTDTPEKYMMAADVLVLPSYREGFGSVIIEAASCGIPALAYKIVGVVDAVEEEKSGLLVELGKTDILAQRMLELARDPQKRRYLGGRARERAVQFFSAGAISNAWRSHYLGSLLDLDEDYSPASDGPHL